MFGKCARWQLGGIAVSLLAWTLCSVSMDLPHWRVWNFQDPIDFKSGMTLVGIWKTCVYQQEDNSTMFKMCYRYTYQDNFIPLDIRIAQHLLLISSFLGIVAIVPIIVALWKLYSRKHQKKTTYNPFKLTGSLNIVASSFIFLSILYNYLSIIRNEGISFPPSFHTPFSPDTQKVGIALVMATFSCFLFLVGGIISLSFPFPQRRCQTHYSNI